MLPDASLLVIEQVLGSPNTDVLFSAESDVSMMVLLGGRERTQEDFAALLASVDLTLAETVYTPTSFSLLIARSAIPDRRTRSGCSATRPLCTAPPGGFASMPTSRCRAALTGLSSRSAFRA